LAVAFSQRLATNSLGESLAPIGLSRADAVYTLEYMGGLVHIRWAVVISLIALLTAAVASARAQEATTGTIAGQVIDAQQLGIPGATVTVTGEQGSSTVVTDAEGNFLVPFLEPGRHTVGVELQVFGRPA
jgi:hypothetical protein